MGGGGRAGKVEATIWGLMGAWPKEIRTPRD